MFRSRRWIIGPAFTLFLLPLLAEMPKLEQPAPLGYVCLKSQKSPVIDGKIDDDAWKSIPWSSEFVDIEGSKKPTPRYRTRVKMTWDERALYIAAELEEPHLWATLDRHDSVIFHDPDFEVFIDPDGDNHLYGEMEMNAKNTTWDLLLTKPYRDGGRAINAWEITGLKTAVSLDGTLNDPTDTDRGWTIEIAWPWESLKELSTVSIPPKNGDTWRINFSRVEWDTSIENGKYVKVKGKPEYNWVWSPQGAINMHMPERWGYLQFSTQHAGNVPYRPELAQGIKDYLHSIYAAERAFHKNNGKYSTDLAELGMPALPHVKTSIEVTRSGFEASIAAPKESGGKIWMINHESRIWSRVP